MAKKKTNKVSSETAQTAPPARKEVLIQPPRFKTVKFLIKGTAPYVHQRFWKKGQVMEAQMAGDQAKTRKKRTPKDFKKEYEESKHKTKSGWCGIPASSFRNAVISACRIVNFKMTLAKLAIFVEADGWDQDGMPIVRINGEPEQHIGYARNDNGSIDIRARPMWKKWTASVRVRFDADMFSETDVANLLHRVGQQVGIGEGRPDSKKSAGLGWGLFEIIHGEAK